MPVRPINKSDEDRGPAVILLVENEGLLRALTGIALDDAGYGVLEAVNAKEALAILEAQADVRLLITDIALPGVLDGLALAHRVRERWPDIGIIILSSRGAFGPPDTPSEVRLLEKPLFPFVLVHEVGALLRGLPQVHRPRTNPKPILGANDA